MEVAPCSLCATPLDPESNQVLYCSLNHAFCIECSTGWVRNLDVPALKGRCTSSNIRCPHFESSACVGIISVDALCEAGGTGADALKEKTTQAAKFFVEDLLECLSIRCPRPTCGVLIDLNPDACAAICCRSCGQNFCACCHARFASSQQTHQHVPLAHNWRDVFLPTATVAEGQQRMRITQLAAHVDILKSAELIDNVLKSAAEQLTDLGLPTDWTALSDAAEAARLTLDQQRLGGDAAGIPATPEAMPGHFQQALTPAQERGNTLLALCFAGRFHDLQPALMDYMGNHLDVQVDWLRRSPIGNTAFGTAVFVPDSFARLAAMQMLIQLGASVTINERDCDGFTALQRFVLINDISSVKFILEQEGLNLEAVTAEGRTALFLAAETRRLHIARELLRAGAYVHTSCRAGMTALIAASLRCALDGVTPGEVVRNVQFWVDAGADIEAADGQCAWRALHYAAAGHYGTGTAAVKTLLRYNAQVTALTRFSQTPLMIAVCFGNTAVIPLLVAAEGASPSIPFESTEELQLNERVVSRRQEIARVLKSAQGWERYKLGWRRRLGLSDRTSRSAFLWMGVGAGVGVGLVAVCVGAWLRFR